MHYCIALYHGSEVYEAVDWSHRRDYIVIKHGVTTAQADEAIADPQRLVLDPDPSSESGRSVRIIGYSSTARAVLQRHGGIMSAKAKKNIAALLDEEAQAVEANPNAG